MIVCRNHSDFRISKFTPLLYYGRGAFFVRNESAGSHQACLYDRFMTNARNVLENISHKARKEAAMIYQKVSADMKFVDREKEVEKFWKDNDIFQKSIDNRKEGPTYTFYDGPPTANGKPHIGHVLTRVIKDMIPRYRTMKGYMVPRKAGWDTHGLPVELEVEKMLGLDGKEQIEEYGIIYCWFLG